MKPTTLTALAAATLLASGTALACDDMKMTGDNDGYGASKAPEAQVAVSDKTQAAPLTVTKKATAKQKTAGKAIAPGTAVMTKTGG